MGGWGGSPPLFAKSILVTLGLGLGPLVLDAVVGTKDPLAWGSPFGGDMGRMGPFSVSICDFFRSALDVLLSRTLVRRSFKASKVT